MEVHGTELTAAGCRMLRKSNQNNSKNANTKAISNTSRPALPKIIYIYGSSVGIATGYGLDGPGSNPSGGRDFPPVQTGPGAHPTSFTMGTGSFPGVKCGRDVLLTTHPLLVSRSWKSRAILWVTPSL